MSEIRDWTTAASSSAVGNGISAALAGQSSVEEALANSQQFAVREMTKAGYIK